MTSIRTMVAFGFLVFLGGALYLSFSFPKEAKVLPLFVLIPGVVLAGWNFFAELKHAKSVPQEGEKEKADHDARRGHYQLLLAAVALPLLSWLFGVTVGIPLFIFVYLRWVSGEGWGSTIFSTVLSWAILYGGFEVLMRKTFEKGLLIELIFF